MEILKIRITGTRPMLMNSDLLSDPLHPMTKAQKALTGKRTKTDDDVVAINMGSWRGSLYFDDELGPFLPSLNIEACLQAGGALNRLKPKIKQGVEVIDLKNKLCYTGPRTVEGLWEQRFYDNRGVGVSGKRVQRYRPMFREWHCDFELAIDEQIIDTAQVMRCLTDAGSRCGIGDFRPKFGRFTVEVLK